MKTLVGSVLILYFLTLSPFAHAECKEGITVEQLLEASKKGEEAFAAMDLTMLLKQASKAREEIVSCIKKPLYPKEAAAFHRLMALEAFTRHDDKRVLYEFHAARRCDPGYTIPPEVAEGDHPLIISYQDAANVPDGAPESIHTPPGGHALVDGVRSAPRLKETPAIIQVYRLELDETWIETKYIQPGETLPKWGDNMFGVTPEDLGIDQTPEWKKSEWYFVPASVSAGLAITFYALALSEKAQFNDLSIQDSQLSGHRERANAFTITSISTASIAAILTGVGIGIEFGYGGAEDPTLQPAVITPPPLDDPSGMGGLP